MPHSGGPQLPPIFVDTNIRLVAITSTSSLLLAFAAGCCIPGGHLQRALQVASQAVAAHGLGLLKDSEPWQPRCRDAGPR